MPPLKWLLTPPLWHLDAVGGRPLHHWHAPPQRASPAPACATISRGLADEGTQERWHDGTEAPAGASESPRGPTHQPAHGGPDARAGSGWALRVGRQPIPLR